MLQENELTIMKAKLYQYHLHRASSNLEELQQRLQEKQEVVNSAKERIKSIVIGSKGIHEQFEKEKQDYNKLKKAAEQAKSEFIAYERKDIKHKEVRRKL